MNKLKLTCTRAVPLIGIHNLLSMRSNNVFAVPVVGSYILDKSNPLLFQYSMIMGVGYAINEWISISLTCHEPSLVGQTFHG